MKISEISREELQNFLESEEFPLIVQKNQEKYKSLWLKWAKKKEKIVFGKNQSWNWAGFLLGEYWLLYRKMYMWAVLCIIIRILAIIQPILMPQYGSMSQILGMIPNMLTALLSYDLYLMQIYNSYIANKDNNKELLSQQGGISLKTPLIYLATFILFIGAIIAIATYDSSDNDNSSYSSSSYSESIEAVRSGIFAIDESIYLANALESYPLFTSYRWEELTTAQGRNIVRFSAEYDLIKEIGTQMVDLNTSRLSEVILVFDFALSLNNSDFSLYSVQLLVDGVPALNEGSSTQEYAVKLLEQIYKNNYLMLSELLFALGKTLVHPISLEEKKDNEEKTSAQSNISDAISLVRNGLLDFDKGISIANALEKYSYFSSYTWEEATNEQGRNIVRFIGNYDINAEIQEMKSRGLLNAEEFLENVSSSALILDFSLDQDKKSFALYHIQGTVNGQHEFAGNAEFVEYLLSPVYRNVPYLGSILNQ